MICASVPLRQVSSHLDATLGAGGPCQAERSPSISLGDLVTERPAPPGPAEYTVSLDDLEVEDAGSADSSSPELLEYSVALDDLDAEEPGRPASPTLICEPSQSLIELLIEESISLVECPDSHTESASPILLTRLRSAA